MIQQSQIAILAEMPTSTDLVQFAPVSLILAPSGCKTIPDHIETLDTLLREGWRVLRVGQVASPRTHTFGQGIRGRRIQYGFKHRIASTVHATMGSDIGKLVTSVSSVDSQFRLWEKEQVVVLLSRTFFASDVIFVGSKEDTLMALTDLIQTRSQYCDYIAHLLDVLCNGSTEDASLQAPVVHNSTLPFRPMDVQLPQEGSGYCYMLVSIRDQKTTYIGQCNSLVERLNLHNRAVGSKQTADSRLRPWSLVAFVCGFEGKKTRMFAFERDWQMKRDRMLQRRQVRTVAQIADLGRSVMEDWREENIDLELRYVQAGTFGL